MRLDFSQEQIGAPYEPQQQAHVPHRHAHKREHRYQAQQQQTDVSNQSQHKYDHPNRFSQQKTNALHPPQHRFEHQDEQPDNMAGKGKAKNAQKKPVLGNLWVQDFVALLR